MNRPNRHLSENSALHRLVMGDTLTLIGALPPADRHMDLDQQDRAEILTRCFVSRYVAVIYVSCM